MKLVTFQSMDALKSLIEKGYLECNSKYVNKDKVGIVYNWLVNKMNESIKNENGVEYPIWAWVKCYNGICPPKRKGDAVEGYDVKITFNKKREDVFITDFRRYSFLLNNVYIPDSLKDKEEFDKRLEEFNITLDDLKAYVRRDKFSHHREDSDFLNICKEIEKSFDKCITTDSDILQGCVWRINLSDIESIEFLNDKSYRYGSLNYIRKNGKRLDWREDYYKKLRKQ